MYCSENFKSKKALKDAIKNGEIITVESPGMGTPKENGTEFVKGPWYPEAHKWYAEVVVENGIITKVR